LDYPDFWFGTTVGAVVAIIAAEPASKSFAALYSTDVRIERLQAEIKVRDKAIEQMQQNVAQPTADLLRQLAVQKDHIDAERVSSMQYQNQVVDLEFRLDAARAPAGKPGRACLEELTSVKGIKLRQGEGSRQVGGRLYFGANMIADQPTVSFCKLRWSSDVESPPNRSNEKLLNPGDSLKLESTVGTFQLALTQVAKDEKGNFCLLDLVRAR
jgi:hypothetical protein